MQEVPFGFRSKYATRDAPGLTIRNKKLLVAKGIATRSKDACNFLRRSLDFFCALAYVQDRMMVLHDSRDLTRGFQRSFPFRRFGRPQSVERRALQKHKAVTVPVIGKVSRVLFAQDLADAKSNARNAESVT